MKDVINPYYVQISKKEAAAILGISPTELDRRRKSDDRCPRGFKLGRGRMAPVRFRLSDVYEYSQLIIAEAQNTALDGSAGLSVPCSSASR